jgi:hypothetical protein
MKLWALAGLFTVAAVPFAGAAEASAECQVDDTRRAPQVRIDNGGPGGSAPVPTAQPTAAPRDADAEQAAQREAVQSARNAVERRRNGKRIPDAELIAPRRTL